MDLTCEKCGTIKSYSEQYDAYYCESCNIWLENVCNDYECDYCNARPEHPNDVNLNT